MKSLYEISLIFAALILILAIFFFTRSEKNSTERLIVHGAEFSVEIADTSAKQSRGLSGREKLDDRSGMLFVFGEEGRYPFWMKDMKFPLDMIWIKKGKIVDISENVPVSADVYPPLYFPSEPVDNVLEINAHEAQRIGIQIGDMISFK